MGTRTRCARLWVAGLVLSGTAAAQGAEYGSRVDLSSFRDVMWREGVGLPSAGTGPGARARARELGVALFAPTASEGLAGLLAVEPPAVSRETLEGTSEALHPVHGVPGGIVLGLESRARGEFDDEIAGARIGRAADGELELTLVSGRRLRCPVIAPERLAACLAFTAQKRDALVDLRHGFGAKPRLAPAFEGGALGALIVRMDGVPHRVRPETRGYKSLIVDRAAGFEARWSEATADLVLTAELEVRLYTDDGSGWARRVATLELGAQSGALDLAAELAPLTELAAWLGFLRRMEGLDPAGIAALRAGVAR